MYFTWRGKLRQDSLPQVAPRSGEKNVSASWRSQFLQGSHLVICLHVHKFGYQKKLNLDLSPYMLKNLSPYMNEMIDYSYFFFQHDRSTMQIDFFKIFNLSVSKIQIFHGNVVLAIGLISYLPYHTFCVLVLIE